MKTHLEEEILMLKREVAEMWQLVAQQLHQAKEALLKRDKDLARAVVATEKRVNAYELSIDKYCENILALYNPVAIDLRFVLATLKINTNLERVGDFAEGIASFVLDIEDAFDTTLLELTQVVSMFDEGEQMVRDLAVAFEQENAILARKVFQKDEVLDDINKQALPRLAHYIHQQPTNALHALQTLSIIRKLERVGDQSKNIAEEIIFYLEAKVLKHNTKKTSK